ncbi:MAG: hypothetical protein AB7S70_17050 [Hyphomicrobium sp.]|uniref:hypothetical protein n=1 Tax=Hyphomicrobium sp. TaxID=82 RepID=UPI003D0E3EF5
MMTMKATFVAAALAAAALSFGGTANAAPIGAPAKAVSTADQSNLQQVHYRRYKHRHYRHYRKYRGHRYGYYRGYRRPGVSIYIGPRYGHRRYWR